MGSCSDSDLPHGSTSFTSLDPLILPCTLPNYFLSSSGEDSLACTSTTTACRTIGKIFDVIVSLAGSDDSSSLYGNANIISQSISDKEVLIPGTHGIVLFDLQSGLLNDKSSLVFSSTNTGTPFFTVCVCFFIFCFFFFFFFFCYYYLFVIFFSVLLLFIIIIFFLLLILCDYY
jgi:hypothetical protein